MSMTFEELSPSSTGAVGTGRLSSGRLSGLRELAGSTRTSVQTEMYKNDSSLLAAVREARGGGLGSLLGRPLSSTSSSSFLGPGSTGLNATPSAASTTNSLSSTTGAPGVSPKSMAFGRSLGSANVLDTKLAALSMLAARDREKSVQERAAAQLRSEGLVRTTALFWLVGDDDEQDTSKSTSCSSTTTSTTSCTTLLSRFTRWHAIILLIGIFLRLETGRHAHSGQGQAPMFGDFEAQRHWVEITNHVPLLDC
ncbi:unnamed protein product [Amoebophrya sp. A25]|nr:unnamed protein product [Amoebophrya sp. A25]|eukprot:GSA25T00011989001.1